MAKLTANEEYMVKAANYIEEVLRGDGGTHAEKDTYNDSLRETYQMSEIITPNGGMGYGSENGGTSELTFSFPGVDESKNLEGPEGTLTHISVHVDPKDFTYAGSDAPWAEQLKKQVNDAVENRRSDVLKIIQELEAYREIMIGALKEFLGQDFENAGLIDKTVENTNDTEEDVVEQKQNRNKGQ